MTTATDHRALLRTLRAAVRAVVASPGPATLAQLSTALLAVPAEQLGGMAEEQIHVVLRNVDLAERNKLFSRIDRMVETVHDQASMRPSWTPAYAGEMVPQAIRLLAACHEQQEAMEEKPHLPWAQAAKAGTRLLDILLRRTDHRPAERLLITAAETFAARLRWATASIAAAHSAWYATSIARQHGLFAIEARDHRATDEWVRRIGHVAYRFVLIPPKEHPDYPHGRVDVCRAGSYDVVHSFPLTARTGATVLDRFLGSL
ncbi:hypothetical protein ACFVHW_04345 [Streptomyces sp. NPDC127110]|uniref:hypothetical protein n=1 Tax=Streptomyces sp. NPDC127110 TaxID=3345362 RepID=UPI003641F395